MNEYQEYEQEYDQNLSRVRSFLSSNVRSLTTLRECERLLAQAKRCATGMEQIAEDGGDAFQISESKFRIQRDIVPLMNEVDRALREKEQGGNGGGGGGDLDEDRRRMLFSGNNSGGYRAPSMTGGDNEADDMEMLIQNSSNLLQESQALCHETEQMGSETLYTMNRQREQLNNASNYLVGAREHVDRARVMLSSMTRKAMRNKMFLYAVIGILVLANVLVLFAKLKKLFTK